MGLCAPAHAALFDVLDGLTKKIAEGTAAADREVDAAFEQELRKELPAYSFGTPAAEQSGRFVKASNLDTIGEVKKVGIVNFSVEFVVEREATARGSTKESTKVRSIPMPDTARMQAIVEDLYAKTVLDLGSLGLEIVPAATLKATKSYGEIKSDLHESPWATDTRGDVEGANAGSNSGAKSIFVSPAGLPTFMDNPKRMSQTISTGLGAMFGTNIPLKLVMIGYDLNREVVLLSANWVVDFSIIKSSGRSLLNVAKVRAARIHHLQAQNSYFRFISAKGVVPLFALKEPLVSEKPIYSEASNVTSDVQDKLNGTEVTVSSDMKFFEDVYYARSAEMLENSRQMFVAEIRRSLPAIAAKP